MVGTEGNVGFNGYQRTSARIIAAAVRFASCLVMLSNSDTDFVRDLYRGYDVRVVYAKRAINCQAEGRGPISELVICNYS